MSAEQLTFWSEEPPANHSASQDSARDWMTLVATWPLSSLELLTQHAPGALYGKTSAECCQVLEDGTLAPFSGRWANSGMGGHTESLTLDGGVSHSAAAECSLLDILEDGGNVPQRYYLTARQLSNLLADRCKHPKSLRIVWRRQELEGVWRITGTHSLGTREASAI